MRQTPSRVCSGLPTRSRLDQPAALATRIRRCRAPPPLASHPVLHPLPVPPRAGRQGADNLASGAGLAQAPGGLPVRFSPSPASASHFTPPLACRWLLESSEGPSEDLYGKASRPGVSSRQPFQITWMQSKPVQKGRAALLASVSPNPAQELSKRRPQPPLHLARLPYLTPLQPTGESL